jgi:hypothetical protein
MIPFNRLDDRAAYYDCIRKLSKFSELLRIRNPKAECNRQFSDATQAPHQFLRIIGQLLARSRYSSPRHRVYKSSRGIRNAPQTGIGTGWGRQKNWRQIICFHGAQMFIRLLYRQIRYKHAVHPSVPRYRTKFLRAHTQDRIQIGKYDQPCRLRVLSNFGRKRQHLRETSSVLQRALACPLNHRTIRHWIAEWHTQLNHVRSGFNRGKYDGARCGEVWIAACYIHHQRRAFMESKGHSVSTKLLIY